ncbi:MAG: class I SAM-dependent methyltransferase, partial [Planctomycetes bacterium]|nr:class I SAM-dependent methyltransferase [Planctomycetota bacterium]
MAFGWLKRTIRSLPGFDAVDRYFCERYTGQPTPEVHRRGHYYSPLPDIAEARRIAATIFDPAITDIPGVDLRGDDQVRLLEQLAVYYEDFDWPDAPSDHRRFYLDQTTFCHGDAVILHAMLRHLRPARIIEVGSGYSSALMLDISDRFAEGRIAFTFIEPEPYRRLDALLTEADRARCRVIADKVQNVPLDTFAALEPNDVLLIDSSHVSRIGSDVNFLMFNVLPILAPGVVIHFHDVHWPFEYPLAWVESGLAWNEAYVLRAFLQHNTA